MSSNVTRRSFFKGAGLAALGGLSAAALSGCGHGYAAAEPTNPSTGDFGGPSWLGAPPVIDEADITETIDTEVLVVGMGTGGIPAMISAAENGAKVLGIDRQGTPHNVREDIGAIDSRLQQASFDEFPEFRIEKKEAVEDIVRYANGFVNYDLVKLWADESGAMVDWLTDIIQRDGKLVMEFEGGVGDTSDPGRDKAFATGHSPQPTDALGEDEEWGFAESILAYAAEQGAEVRWYTEFIKCETDEVGRVTGVIARDVQGDRHYLRINASRGVILSTGGYGNNLEMMEDRQAWNQKIRIAAPGSGGNPTGSGIKAALWLGATMDPLGAACTFNRACVKPDQYAGDRSARPLVLVRRAALPEAEPEGRALLQRERSLRLHAALHHHAAAPDLRGHLGREPRRAGRGLRRSGLLPSVPLPQRGEEQHPHAGGGRHD